jgi:hypothetical protein
MSKPTLLFFTGRGVIEEETPMRSERARFLSGGEKSEGRIERVFLAGEKARGFEAIAPRLPLSPRRVFSPEPSASVKKGKKV